MTPTSPYIPRCCGQRMARLYRREQKDKVREWIPVGWFCLSCHRVRVVV